jgi:hypothetical protein
MLERRIRRGREEEFFTVVMVGELEAGVFVMGRFLTFLCECFWVVEDIFKFVGHVEDFV